VSIGKSNRSLVVAVVACAVFMTNLDLWIVNVALDSIGRDLPGSSLSGISWVLNGYAVALAALLIVAGRLGDRVGHRRLFLIGTAVFTAASLGCAVAPDLGALVGFRVIQAIGAALQLPTSLALLLAVTPAERRHSAARAWSAVGALAAACGPVLGGLLVQASWRWVFVINVPIGIAALIVGRRVLPHPPRREQQPIPDLFGSLLLTVSVAALTGGIVQGPTWAWASGRVVGLLALAAVALAGFGWRCARHSTPLIELPLLRMRPFGAANGAAFVLSIAFAIMLLSNALWCQGIWGYSPIRTGLAMAAGPAVVPFVTIASNRLVARLGPGPLCRRLPDLRGGAGLAGGVLRSAAELAHRDAAGDAARRHRGRTGPRHADRLGRHRAAAGPIRDRCRRRQHRPSGRVQCRGGDPGRDHRRLRGASERQPRLRGRLDGRRRAVGAGRPGLAAGDPPRLPGRGTRIRGRPQ
jgi:MFS family permease